MRNYGETLKEHRLARGVTLKDVESATGISNQNLSRWERGEVLPNIDFCVQLADFYGITLDELVGRDSRGNSGAKYNIGTLNNHGRIDMK